MKSENQSEVKFNVLNNNSVRVSNSIHYNLENVLLGKGIGTVMESKSVRSVSHNEKKADSMKTYFIWLQFSFTLLA